MRRFVHVPANSSISAKIERRARQLPSVSARPDRFDTGPAAETSQRNAQNPRGPLPSPPPSPKTLDVSNRFYL